MSRIDVDWKQVVSDLRGQDLSDYKIASCCGIHITQLGRISKGAEPRYRVGQLLLALRDALCHSHNST